MTCAILQNQTCGSCSFILLLSLQCQWVWSHTELGKAPEKTGGQGEDRGDGEELQEHPSDLPWLLGDTSRLLSLHRAAERSQLMLGRGGD